MRDDVVVKTLQSDELDWNVDRVFTEAQALRRLDHPSIIRLSDCGYAEAGGTSRPYLAMDYFEGVNLESYVAEQGLLSPEDLLAVVFPVAEALQAAHARGILHRDVKPANILVRRDGSGWRVKLIDFGLALRPETLEGKASTQGSQARTTIGRSIAGTLHYAAPEQMGQAPGVPVGAYSDVYGFGKTCYYALLATPDPDDGEKESLPDGWRRLLARCTGRKIDNRLPDFTAVLAELPQVIKPGSELERDMKDALEEGRTKGSTRAYFERQGPTRIGAWQAAAQRGDAAAQWLLSRCLQEGAGAQKDTQAAVSWLRRAAEGGLAVAQNDLGNCYYAGQGVEADSTEAFRWFTRAGEQELAQALVSLGVCYDLGEGVEKNPAEAARLFRQAAEMGHPTGQDYLGNCYFGGYGVEQDYPQAIGWYRRAAEQGLASAQFNLGSCYEYGKGLKKDWGEAAKWYRKAAEQDSGGAQFALGSCYQFKHWHLKGTTVGCDEAQFALGSCYQYGRGVEQDLAQAEQWYRKAADQGHRRAKNAFARLRGDAKPEIDGKELEGEPGEESEPNGGNKRRRKEQTLRVLQRHGLLDEGTEIELMPDAMPNDGVTRDQAIFQAKIGSFDSQKSVVWIHDGNTYSLTELSVKLEQHGLTWIRPKTFELWRIVGQTDSMWVQADKLRSPGPSGILGYSATSVMHWAGQNGWTFEQIRKMLAHYGADDIKDSSVRTCLCDAKNPKYAKPAPLTQEQADELNSLR